MYQHSKDSDCTIDRESNCCTVCGVEHDTPCLECGGRGFHLESCGMADTEDPRDALESVFDRACLKAVAP